MVNLWQRYNKNVKKKNQLTSNFNDKRKSDLKKVNKSIRCIINTYNQITVKEYYQPSFTLSVAVGG